MPVNHFTIWLNAMCIPYSMAWVAWTELSRRFS